MCLTSLGKHAKQQQQKTNKQTKQNNISAISWRSVYWWSKLEYPEKTTNMPQVTDKI